MQIKINGVVNEILDNSSVEDILMARELPLDIVIIVLNGEIIGQENWAGLKLNHDDNLEIIRIIGGG